MSRFSAAFAGIALLLMLSVPAGAQDHNCRPGYPCGSGHFADGHRWDPHPGWRGDILHFDFGYWRGGHWWYGPYFGVSGWWWIVGPGWYWYPQPVYPYPNPYAPAGSAPGYWYYCDAYQQYYPYVGACPSGWRAVPPNLPAPPPPPALLPPQ